MLQLAVSGGHHTIAKALIEGRAAVNNVSNVTGTTPLLIAVMQVAVNLYANIHLTSMLHTTTIHAAQTCIQHAMQICVKHTYNTQYATCVRHVYMHYASAWMWMAGPCQLYRASHRFFRRYFCRGRSRRELPASPLPTTCLTLIFAHRREFLPYFYLCSYCLHS